jgi:hypothetical protein
VRFGCQRPRPSPLPRSAIAVQAIGLLLDRGWGKAPQPHTGGEDGKDIHVTIRQIIETTGGENISE